MTTCPECGQRFRWLSHLQRHAQYMHVLTNAQAEWIFYPRSRAKVARVTGYDGRDVPAVWKTWDRTYTPRRAPARGATPPETIPR